MKKNARLADRYVRCDDFATRIDGVELAPEVWAVFAQLSRPRTADELARRLKLAPDVVASALRRLARRKLARKHVLAWRDYTATAPATPNETESTPAPATPNVTSGTSAPDTHPGPTATSVAAPYAPGRSVPPFYVSAAPSPAPAPARPIVSLRIISDCAQTPPPPAVSLRLGRPSAPHASTPSTTSASATPGLRLRPVLDAIGAKAGGGVAGQLLAYRIFLQIPTALMQAAGLQSLSLVDDNYTLTHPELRAALAETARAHAGIDIESLATA